MFLYAQLSKLFMTACDIYDLPVSSADNNSNMDHDLDGFGANTNFIGDTISNIKVPLYRVGSPSSSTIQLKHYEGSTLIQTYNANGSVSWDSLSTSASSPTDVEWIISPAVEITANTKFGIPGVSSGANQGRSVTVGSGVPSPTIDTVYSNNNGTSWIVASWSMCGCITSGGGVSTSDTLLPPPVAWI